MFVLKLCALCSYADARGSGPFKNFRKLFREVLCKFLDEINCGIATKYSYTLLLVSVNHKMFKLFRNIYIVKSTEHRYKLLTTRSLELF